MLKYWLLVLNAVTSKSCFFFSGNGHLNHRLQWISFLVCSEPCQYKSVSVICKSKFSSQLWIPRLNLISLFVNVLRYPASVGWSQNSLSMGLLLDYSGTHLGHHSHRQATGLQAFQIPNMVSTTHILPWEHLWPLCLWHSIQDKSFHQLDSNNHGKCSTATLIAIISSKVQCSCYQNPTHCFETLENSTSFATHTFIRWE